MKSSYLVISPARSEYHSNLAKAKSAARKLAAASIASHGACRAMILALSHGSLAHLFVPAKAKRLWLVHRRGLTLHARENERVDCVPALLKLDYSAAVSPTPSNPAAYLPGAWYIINA